MSNPHVILKHRVLMPLPRHVYFAPATNYENDIKKINVKPIMKNDILSPESVTNYLLTNPNFVESFLMKYYSKANLVNILNKISPETKELIFLPKKARIFSNFNLTKAISSSTKNSSEISGLFKEYSQSSKDTDKESKSEISHLKILDSKESSVKGSVYDEDVQSTYKSVQYKKMVLKVPDEFSMSKKETSFSENVLHLSENQEDLLREVKHDLMSILNCDGANHYVVDNINKRIFLNDGERITYQNIEKGTSLAAYVACEKVFVNSQDIFMDQRFPLGIITGNSFVKSVIAKPISKMEEQIGILELYRNADKHVFSTKDEEIFNSYCMWAELAIHYNETDLVNQKQKKLNRFLLKVTQKMFGKIRNSELIIKEIMASAKNLVKADRVSLFLLDKESNELYARIFDKGNFEECIFETKENVIRVQLGEGIAGNVAATGETLNIHDAYNDKRFNRIIDSITGYVTKTILCMPVKLRKEVIGVVQMLNKRNGIFTEEDEADFENFATYCGLALYISRIYQKILRSQQKYKVALDVLSYHNGYSIEEFDQLRKAEIPSFVQNIDKLSFWPWTVDSNLQPLYTIYMFKDLFGLHTLYDLDKYHVGNYPDSELRFDEETLMRFVLTIKKNYRVVPYHNWIHAFSVAQAMYALLKTTKYNFNIYESLALFIGCLCHDLDHRGKTNKYMLQNSTPLSVLYSTSTMEHHHFNMTITILQRDGHNILSRFSSNNYKKVLSKIKHCILATDLIKHFEYMSVLNSSPNFTSSQSRSNRLRHMALSMTFCDLSAMYKSWDMQLTLVMSIMKEFWTQGDEEKLKGLEPLRLMDRDFMLELPERQVEFLTCICIPCYEMVSKIMPEVHSVLGQAENNLAKWTHLSNLETSEKSAKLKELEHYVEQFITENKLHVR